MSIRRYLVPKRDIVPDLEKIVPPSMAKAVRKEVESTTHVAAAEQSGSVAMGSMKRANMTRPSQRPRKPRSPGMPLKMALQQPCVISRQSKA